MMSDVAISVENLCKSYLIGHQAGQRERYTSLRDVIAREAHNFARKGLDLIRGREIVQGDELEQFWALRDVSFEIKRGEVFGIVGRNGAGKSTLLKILSRITEPDRGRAVVRGRVSSLLEVGTGFHPELTGRENIFLNGAILGMTRAEIRKKFDEIVAFAEVERFLDTPVKRYSSGMHVRLAFAVAAHLTPDILLVDEVLAVGDAEFQKKCLGVMQHASTSEGRTVLFVSHNMAAVQALCSRAILLDNGRLVGDGTTDEVVDQYMRQSGSFNLSDAAMASNDFELCRLKVGSPDGAPLTTFKPGLVEVAFRPKRDVIDAGAHIIFEDLNASPVMGLDTTDFREKVRARAGQEVVCSFQIESLPLNPGPYRLRMWLKSHLESLYWEVPKSFEVNVEETLVYGTRRVERQSHGVAAARTKVRIDTV